jgi:hypothetical protein
LTYNPFSGNRLTNKDNKLRERSYSGSVVVGWDAEGETPIERGKLSGKRTVIYHILWRELFVRPPKGKAQSLRAKGNLSGKRTGELWDCSEAPLFYEWNIVIMGLVDCFRGRSQGSDTISVSKRYVKSQPFGVTVVLRI